MYATVRDGDGHVMLCGDAGYAGWLYDVASVEICAELVSYSRCQKISPRVRLGRGRDRSLVKRPPTHAQMKYMRHTCLQNGWEPTDTVLGGLSH